MDLPEKQLDPRDKLFLERGSIPVFIRKHIAICDFPGGRTPAPTRLDPPHCLVQARY